MRCTVPFAIAITFAVLRASAAVTPGDAGGGLADLQATVHDVAQHVRRATVKISRPGSQGHGTGFVIDPAGWVITNYHVASHKGATYRAEFEDGRRFDGRRIGYIKYYDLALLKIPPSGEPLPFLQLADSDRVTPGTISIACGNPYEYAGTISWGMISAVRRVFNEGIWSSSGLKQTLPVLMTDTPINPGNSGGPLVNLYGEVIGVNSAIVPLTIGMVRLNVGVGFAVPSNVIVQYLDDLKRGREFDLHKPWVGLTVKRVSDDLARTLDIPCGLLVKEIDPRGPASDAPIEDGDILTTIDGQPVSDPSDLEAMMSVTRPGRTIACDVLRRTATGQPAQRHLVAIKVAPHGSR